eukprot:7428755-Alexandrium_andersonii.AAC.1
MGRWIGRWWVGHRWRALCLCSSLSALLLPLLRLAACQSECIIGSALAARSFAGIVTGGTCILGMD